MAKLANIVTLAVKPGKADAVVAALLAHKERSLGREPGTLQFEVLRPPEGDTALTTFEVYADDAAFETHRSAPSLAQLRSDISDLITNLEGSRYALVD